MIAGKKCRRLENNEFECDVKKEKAILAIPEKQNVDGSASLLISPTGKLKFHDRNLVARSRSKFYFRYRHKVSNRK